MLFIYSTYNSNNVMKPTGRMKKYEEQQFFDSEHNTWQKSTFAIRYDLA